jgi:hypothetical protein
VEDLRGRYLEASAPTEALPEGAYYWHQIIGLEVLETDGAPLGRVTDVFRAGGGEVFVVRGPRGELMVPAVGDVVRELAPDAGRIVVDTEALGLDDVEPRSRVRGRRTTRARKAAERGEGSAPVREDPGPVPAEDTDGVVGAAPADGVAGAASGSPD